MKNLKIALAILAGSALVTGGVAFAVHASQDKPATEASSTTSETYESTTSESSEESYGEDYEEGGDANPTFASWTYEQIVAETCESDYTEYGGDLFYYALAATTCINGVEGSGLIAYAAFPDYESLQAQMASNGPAFDEALWAYSDTGPIFAIIGDSTEMTYLESYLTSHYGFTVIY